MQIRQHAYVALKSDDLDADEMTSRVGTAPDDVSVMGSKTPQPPVPACHAWIVRSSSNRPVDVMVSELITRLRPFAPQITTLVTSGEVDAVLQVVRCLDDPDGEPENVDPRDVDGQSLEKLPGQHDLLGFHLDTDVLRFLADTGIELDVDEYG